MAGTGIIHHFGTFLLFSATILLIITCVSAPVVDHLALFRIDVPRGSQSIASGSLTFGTFGYCQIPTSG
jgi:hypothetical protein